MLEGKYPLFSQLKSLPIKSISLAGLHIFITQSGGMDLHYVQLNHIRWDKDGDVNYFLEINLFIY